MRLKILEERAKEVQGKYSLKARRSLSRKNSPAKEAEPSQIILDSPEAASPLTGSLKEIAQKQDVVFTPEAEVASQPVQG